MLRLRVSPAFPRARTRISLRVCSDANGSESIEKMSEIGPGSLQQETCVGGAQQLSVGLAERVLRRGGRILLSHRVVHISHGKPRRQAALPAPAAADAGSDVAGASAADVPASVSIALEHHTSTSTSTSTSSKPVLLTCANGVTIAADHVVIAAPAPVAHAYISFAPVLSPERAALMRGATMGSIIKAIVIYPRAFWRRDGFSGEVVCDTASHPDGGPCFNLFDGCGLVGSSAGGGSLGLRGATSHIAPSSTSSRSGSQAGSRLTNKSRSRAALGPVLLPSEGSSTVLPAAPPSSAPASAAAGAGAAGFAFLLPIEARTAAPTAHWVAPAVAAWVAAGRPAAAAPAIEFVSGPHPVSGAPARFVPALVAFINGERAHAWSSARVSADARRAAVLRQIGAWFGAADEAAAPLEYVEHDWGTYPHTRGCPVASYGAGVLEAYGVARPLSQPEWPATPGAASSEHHDDAAAGDGRSHSRYGAVDTAAGTSSSNASGAGRGTIHRLHWAGTETSTVSTGFIDGAIRSGWRAAAEVATDAAVEAAAVAGRAGAISYVHTPVPAETMAAAAAAAAVASAAGAGSGAAAMPPPASPAAAAAAAAPASIINVDDASSASAAESASASLRAPLLENEAAAGGAVAPSV